METEPCSAQPSWVELRHLLQVECSIELVQAVACTQLNENVHDASKQFGVMQQDALYFEDTHTNTHTYSYIRCCFTAAATRPTMEPKTKQVAAQLRQLAAAATAPAAAAKVQDMQRI